MLGEFVGAIVGPTVGEDVGPNVGRIDGLFEGIEDGDDDGLSVLLFFFNLRLGEGLPATADTMKSIPMKDLTLK